MGGIFSSTTVTNAPVMTNSHKNGTAIGTNTVRKNERTCVGLNGRAIPGCNNNTNSPMSRMQH